MQFLASNAAMPARPPGCRQEGVRALWTGLGPNIARNAIVSASALASYDQVKQTLLKSGEKHFLYFWNVDACACVCRASAESASVGHGLSAPLLRKVRLWCRPGCCLHHPMGPWRSSAGGLVSCGFKRQQCHAWQRRCHGRASLNPGPDTNKSVT